MSTSQEEVMDWKSQYEDLTKQLQDLRRQNETIQEQNEELKHVCEDQERENKLLRNKVSEEKNKVKEVNQLIEPALDEYKKLQSKYEIEKGCRHEAEVYASQIVRQNKKLKRQSMDLIAVLNKSSMPLHMMDINLDEDDKEEKQLENGYQETLNNTIKELKNEVAILKTSLAKTREELQVEKENHRWAVTMHKNTKAQLLQAEQSLKQHKQAMKDLSSISEAAYEEYESLKEKYALEVKRRSVFERKIEEVAVQNNKMKRQSEVLLSKITPGDQLHKALMEIEDLTDKLEQQRKFYDAEIAKLEEKVSDNSSHDTDHQADLQTIESEKASLEAENEALLKQVQETNNKYSALKDKYDELAKKYEEAKNPPPPPPPPPLPDLHASKGFLSKIIKKKKIDKEAKLKIGGAQVNPDFSKALDEMMENIKRGKTLRPALKPIRRDINEEGAGDFRMVLKSKSFDDFSGKEGSLESSESQPKTNAMTELQNIMNKLKRNRSETDLLSPLEADGETELARTFRRIKKSSSVDTDPDVTRRDKLSIVSEERDSDVFKNNDVFRRT